MKQVYAEVGSSLQQISGNCPDGWIVMQGERPTPEHVAQEGGIWALPEPEPEPELPPDWPSAIAERRWEVEVCGIVVAGFTIATDDRSKLLINGAAVEAMLDPSYQMQWKTPAGFVELTGAQVIGIARAVRAHVQACFDREAELLAALKAGTLTEEMLGLGWPAG